MLAKKHKIKKYRKIMLKLKRKHIYITAIILMIFFIIHLSFDIYTNNKKSKDISTDLQIVSLNSLKEFYNLFEKKLELDLTNISSLENFNKFSIRINPSSTKIAIKNRNEVYIFDIHGNFLSKIQNYGSGSKNYKEILRYYAYEDGIFVFSSNFKIQKYSYEGTLLFDLDYSKFIKKFDLSAYVFFDFIVSMEKIAFFCNNLIDKPHIRMIYVTDTTFNFFKSFEIFDDISIPYMSQPDVCLLKNNSFLFTFAGSENVYSINRSLDSISKYFNLNFKNDKSILFKLAKVDLSNPSDIDIYQKYINQIYFPTHLSSYDDNIVILSNKYCFLLNHSSKKVAFVDISHKNDIVSFLIDKLKDSNDHLSFESGCLIKSDLDYNLKIFKLEMFVPKF